MLPTVHKRCLGAVFAALLCLLAAAPAQAAKSPKIKTAYAVDSDHDGHVDGVSLKWSKAIRGGYDAKAPFAISVKGYRVTKVGGALGKAQHVDVAERPECDTGGSVRLSFRARRGTAPIKPFRGKRADRASTSSTCAASTCPCRGSRAPSRSTPTPTGTSTACG